MVLAQIKHEGGIDYQVPHDTSGSTCTMLMVAVEMGVSQIVRLLLANGADPNISGPNVTTLMVAIYSINRLPIELLLNGGADPNIIRGRHGPALVAALRCGGIGMVRLLLDKGADINIVGGEYGTALIAAVFYRKKEIVQLLLEKGADVKIVGGKYNNNALATAVYGAAINIRSSKNIKEFDLSKLLWIVTSLLEAGEDPNTSYSVEWGVEWGKSYVTRYSVDAVRYTYGSLR